MSKHKSTALDAVLRAGQRCSNCCYNLAQCDKVSERAKAAMQEARKAWDEATLNLYGKNGGRKKG